MKKSALFLFFILFSFIEGIPPQYEDEDNTVVPPKSIAYNFTTSPAPPILTTTLNSGQDSLDDISIQDILSSDIDASDKIEKKIINAVTQFSSNCNIYKKIELSLGKFVFPRSTIDMDLGVANASFYDVTIKEESDTNNNRKKYSAFIGCDSSRTAKVGVTLSNNIKISSNIKITETTDSSESLSLQSHEGSISILLKNNSISKQFNFQANDSNNEENTTWKISYSKTEVFLDIDTKYQKHIYINLVELLNELELPLERFLVNELNAELSKNNITVGQSCSKFINVDTPSKKINSSFLKSDFNNLYVISNVSLETWKGVGLSAGPIVIHGLSHLNSTELIVTDNGISKPSSDGYYQSTPKSDDAERKEVIVRVKTNGLKGKLDWSYNLKPRSFPFSIDFILFEVKKIKTFRYTSSYDYNYSRYKYNRSDDDKIDINIYLGNIRIKSSKSSTCENEKEFVNFVLSEYLKTVVKDSLRNSLVAKLQNNVSVVNC